jgi:hypothetical protein
MVLGLVDVRCPHIRKSDSQTAMVVVPGLARRALGVGLIHRNSGLDAGLRPGARR